MTATDLKKRAIALAEKTKIDSVTPEEVGQLSNDIVEYIENVEINGSSLGIRKTYTSVSAMEADSTAPKDDKGVLLRRGMLVNIYNQEYPESADNGKVFSFQNPGWAFRGTVDAGYATRDELTELEKNTGLSLAYKLNKSELPVKDVEESGIYFVDEKGNAFMVYSNEKGLDVSKISSEMAAKVLAFLNKDDFGSNCVADVEEEGAYLCNEKGEVFARFVNGKFEAAGLSIEEGGSTVEYLEDIKNVTGGSNGQFLQKQPNGNWAGANIVYPQYSISNLTDVNVNPKEGSILQYKGGKWVNAEISTEGLITTDSRVSNPLYGKHFICLGDSHSAIQSFLPKLAELTGSIYHPISEKNIDGSTHIIIDGADKGTFNKAYPYDWSAYIQAVIDAEIQIDYLIIENCHFGEKTKWDNAIESFPFVGYQKIVYPEKFNSFADLNSHITNELWAGIISELGINDIKKSIEFQYLASASQTLVFSFTEGDTLNTDVTVTIKFGEDGNPINTTLTTGMSLDECVSKINDWAFQEYSDWTNANKGTTGITEIDLTYSGGDEGKPDVLATVTYSTECNLQCSVDFSEKYNSFFYVYNLPEKDGILTKSNWVAHGSGAIGWYFPQPLMGALFLLGKHYTNAKTVICGIGNYSTSEIDSVFTDGTINCDKILNSNAAKQGITSWEISKDFAEKFKLQFIDIDHLCGITPYNMYPTYYNYNDVHLKEAGYNKWAECIAYNIK